MTKLCPACEGKGFLEYEAGLIQIRCTECGGIGEVAVSAEPKEKIEEKQTIEEKPKKGQYFCTKCGSCHFENRKTGQRHLKYKK